MNKTLTASQKVRYKAARDIKQNIRREQQRQDEREAMAISAENALTISFIPIGVSPIRVALKFAKTYGTKGFLPERLNLLNPALFHSKQLVAETIAILCQHEFFKQCGDGKYAITARGLRGVSLIVQREPGRNAYVYNEED